MPHGGAQRCGTRPQAGAQLQVGEQVLFHQVDHHVLVADEQVGPAVGHRPQRALGAGFAQQPGGRKALAHQRLDAGASLHGHRAAAKAGGRRHIRHVAPRRQHQVRGEGRPGEHRVRLASGHRRGERGQVDLADTQRGHHVVQAAVAPELEAQAGAFGPQGQQFRHKALRDGGGPVLEHIERGKVRGEAHLHHRVGRDPGAFGRAQFQRRGTGQRGQRAKQAGEPVSPQRPAGPVRLEPGCHGDR